MYDCFLLTYDIIFSLIGHNENNNKNKTLIIIILYFLQLISIHLIIR